MSYHETLNIRLIDSATCHAPQIVMTRRVGDNFNIEEVATRPVKIVPSLRKHGLHSLEGGVLHKLMVHESGTVEKGPVMAETDPTRSEASFRESEPQDGANKKASVSAGFFPLSERAYLRI